MFNNVYWMYKRSDKKTKVMFWGVFAALVLLLGGLVLLYSNAIAVVFSTQK